MKTQRAAKTIKVTEPMRQRWARQGGVWDRNTCLICGMAFRDECGGCPHSIAQNEWADRLLQDAETVQHQVADLLTAALPTLERQIREQVAAEILAMPNNYPAGPRNIYTRAQQDAAKIARGNRA